MQVGITALIPPEIIFATGNIPVDVNNFIPFNDDLYPLPKLCSWSASWRDLIINGKIPIDALAIVAGGDCHNTLVDGERVEKSGFPAHYFFYPMDADADYFSSQIDSLIDFLGGLKKEEYFDVIYEIKEKLKRIEYMRKDSDVSPEEIFSLVISASDMKSSVSKYGEMVDDILALMESYKEYNNGNNNNGNSKIINVGLIGVPPIMNDFHAVLMENGFRTVYDELPWEFIRLGGKTTKEITMNYMDYSFAKHIDRRIKIIKEEIKKRNIEALVHYTQFSCHHILEDDIFRNAIDIPILTIQGDLPGKTPEQSKLRIEAFHEMLEGVQ